MLRTRRHLVHGIACIVITCPISASASLTVYSQPLPISPTAIADDPALAVMQSFDIMVQTTGDWASAGMEALLPTGFHFYNHNLGGNTKPDPGVVSKFPALAFDTYVTAPSDDGVSGAPAILGGFPASQPLSMSGNRLSVAWGNLQVDPPGTYSIARLTFRRGILPLFPEESNPYEWSQTSQVNPEATRYISFFPRMRESLWLSDEDGAWHVPGNWSNGVPGVSPSPIYNEHANIDVGGATVRTITHSEGSHTISTLLSEEHIAISGGLLTVQAYGRMSRGLTITGGTLAGRDVLRINGELSITGTGAINLIGGSLINDYADESPLATLREKIVSGYNDGMWDGPGITSSTAASNSNLAVGYAEASALFTSFPAIFEGEEIDDTTVIIRLVHGGDANLDGIVNLADFNKLAANFGSNTALWSDGDFTYDGLVNLDDFNKLAANFGLSAGPDGPTPADWSALASMLPEPSSAIFILAGMALLRRRRRCSRG